MELGSKIRGVMNRMFKVAIINKKVTKNPVEGLESSTKSDQRTIKITPAQPLSILRSMMQLNIGVGRQVGPLPAYLAALIWFYSDFVVDRALNPPFAAKVSFRCLNLTKCSGWIKRYNAAETHCQA